MNIPTIYPLMPEGFDKALVKQVLPVARLLIEDGLERAVCSAIDRACRSRDLIAVLSSNASSNMIRMISTMLDDDSYVTGWLATNGQSISDIALQMCPGENFDNNITSNIYDTWRKLAKQYRLNWIDHMIKECEK